MAIDAEGLGPCERGVGAIEVPPARLHHGDGGVLKKRQGLQKKVRCGHKIGIEDGDEFARRLVQALPQGPGFVSLPMRAMLQDDVETQVTILRDELLGQRRRVIRGVIENLDLQAGSRIDERTTASTSRWMT